MSRDLVTLLVEVFNAVSEKEAIQDLIKRPRVSYPVQYTLRRNHLLYRTTVLVDVAENRFSDDLRHGSYLIQGNSQLESILMSSEVEK
jgi:hypothetical protein